MGVAIVIGGLYCHHQSPPGADGWNAVGPDYRAAGPTGRHSISIGIFLVACRAPTGALFHWAQLSDRLDFSTHHG